MAIEARGLSFSYGGAPVLRSISFSAGSGEVIALLGPNGVGKSTLLRCLLGFLRPSGGEVLVNERAIGTLSRRALAREIAYIPQSYSPAFNYTVRDSVLMGVTAKLGTLDSPGAAEHARVMQTLEELGIAHLADRGSRQISGGERQLMLLARALVQDAHVLIMDEPTANLDYGNSFRVMERIEQLGKSGYTVIFSTHEPNHAFRYATRALAMQSGALLGDGKPDEVLREELLSALYGVTVAVRHVAVNGQDLAVSVPCRTNTQPER